MQGPPPPSRCSAQHYVRMVLWCSKAGHVRSSRCLLPRLASMAMPRLEFCLFCLPPTPSPCARGLWAATRSMSLPSTFFLFVQCLAALLATSSLLASLSSCQSLVFLYAVLAAPSIFLAFTFSFLSFRRWCCRHLPCFWPALGRRQCLQGEGALLPGPCPVFVPFGTLLA